MNKYRKKYTRYKKIKLKFYGIRRKILKRRAFNWFNADLLREKDVHEVSLLKRYRYREVGKLEENK